MKRVTMVLSFLWSREKIKYLIINIFIILFCQNLFSFSGKEKQIAIQWERELKFFLKNGSLTSLSYQTPLPIISLAAVLFKEKTLFLIKDFEKQLNKENKPFVAKLYFYAGFFVSHSYWEKALSLQTGFYSVWASFLLEKTEYIILPDKKYYPLFSFPFLKNLSERDRFFLFALLKNESHFDSLALSSQKAFGIAQIKKETFAHIQSYALQKEEYASFFRHKRFEDLREIEFSALAAWVYLLWIREFFKTHSLFDQLCFYNAGVLFPKLKNQDLLLQIELCPYPSTARYIKNVFTDMVFYYWLYSGRERILVFRELKK